MEKTEREPGFVALIFNRKKGKPICNLIPWLDECTQRFRETNDCDTYIHRCSEAINLVLTYCHGGNSWLFESEKLYFEFHDEEGDKLLNDLEELNIKVYLQNV